MKKITLLILLFCAIFVAALVKGGRQVTGGTAATGIAFLLPHPAMDLSDLDVRDAQNSPSKDTLAAQELATLFRENLVNLTVFANLHPTTEVFSWINSISHLFNGMFVSRLSVKSESILDTFLPPFKRFVHNVDNLWITFSVGTFAGYLLLFTIARQRSSQHVPLRC